MKKFMLTSAMSFIGLISYAQSYFSTQAFVDIGNIKAIMGVHGSMWEGDTAAGCEFPKGSGKHIAYTGSLWMGGYFNGSLNMAANLYSADGYEYWPGPIVDISNPQVSYSESQKWDKIWKVNRSDINTFLTNSTHTINNTPASVLDWPGRGNTYATGNSNIPLFVPANDYDREFAPFIDVDNDGMYNPLAGDYPDITGDQGVWTVFNDYGAAPHAITKSAALGMEVQLLAYAYNRNSLVDNIIFYNYRIINRAGQSLDSFKVGFFADMNLGYPFDDYIGYDSSRNLGIIYNGSSNDGTDSRSYGNSIPKAGIQVLKMPAMSCNSFSPAGSFMEPGGAIPGNAPEFYHYLSSSFATGQHLKNDYQGQGIPSGGTGPGNDATYIFSGDISNMNEWSECASSNIPGDRKMVIASKAMTVTPGQIIDFSIALVASDPSLNNGCPAATFSDIREVADTAAKVFCNPLPHSPATGISENTTAQKIRLYPNPVNDQLFISLPEQEDITVTVFDVSGRKMKVPVCKSNRYITVDAAVLPAGFYSLHLQGKNISCADKFIKQ